MSWIISRRQFALGLGGAMLSIMSSGATPTAGQNIRNRKMLFIILRGAADGLSILAPIGDTYYQRARGILAEDKQPRLPVAGFFGLHNAMGKTHALYQNREATFYPATGLSHPVRSHFDAQNMLETGTQRAYQSDSGWLNRALSLLAHPGEGIAFAPTIPLALAGSQPVSSVILSESDALDTDFTDRITMLLESEPELLQNWSSALNISKASQTAMDGSGKSKSRDVGLFIADIMTNSVNAGMATLELNGWDTHSKQDGRLDKLLKNLDAIIDGLNLGMGDDWRDMLVVVATEFGRTVKPNGTRGTDHGTGSLAIALGGNLEFGNVACDWPGLSPSQLFEGRDLRIVKPIEEIILGLVSTHMSLDRSIVKKTLYPTL
jgi:uncharacterized protein (DUF1501 family)